MRSHRHSAMAALLLLGTVLAIANAWFAAARSTIPLRLDGEVIEMRQLSEKHPGRDDVYLLNLRENGMVQVDRDVFQAVEVGVRITKEPWARHLDQAGGTVNLHWSADLRGMLWTMPGILAVMLVTLVWAWKRN